MKKMTDVRIYGDPVLRRAAKKVDAINEEIKEMIPVLVKTMQTEDGVGLAANQIGITERVIAVSDGTQVFVIINPTITSWSERKVSAEEGCLSFPGYYAEVERSAKVIVKGLQEDGSELELVARGILARAIQHEIDHLNGILFVDRMNPETLKRLIKKEGKEESEYIPTTLTHLKKHFKDTYHRDLKTIVYDREEELT